jgi:hypothetical protein
MALSKESKRYRGQVAALSRMAHNGERPPDDPALTEARRNLAAARLTERVKEIIENWPPLSAEQVNDIAALLRAGKQPDEPGTPAAETA